jgi:hypothetical protein
MHMMLKEMTDRDIFSDMKDGYRLAASVALNRSIDVSNHTLENRKNMYDVGGVDEDFIFRNAVAQLYPEFEGQEYKHLEKFADVGVQIIYEQFDGTGGLNIEELMKNAP